MEEEFKIGDRVAVFNEWGRDYYGVIIKINDSFVSLLLDNGSVEEYVSEYAIRHTEKTRGQVLAERIKVFTSEIKGYASKEDIMRLIDELWS